jgi:hypothetical protein
VVVLEPRAQLAEARGLFRIRDALLEEGEEVVVLVLVVVRPRLLE